uniref:Alpha-1,3/1,6-mannosyltransferase ALG2 n=1 Tax=Globodera rostochiensis TaxID=31243 RepID=A0A914HMN3_GLORO
MAQDPPNVDMFSNNNCHPITFANTLMKLGHEPYPLSRGKKWILFGESVYFHPNIFKYLTNVCRSHGFMTICTGFGANLVAFVAYDFFCTFTARFMDQSYPEIGGKMDDDMLQVDNANDLDNYQLFRVTLRQAIRDTISHSIGTVVARPFIVVMVRQIAQHISNEYKYQPINFLQPLLHIGAQEGPAGFFSGLVPQLVSEFFFVWGMVSLGYGVELSIRYLEKDQDPSDLTLFTHLRSSYNFLVRWLVNGWRYRFDVVSTVLAVSGSGLAVSMLPFSPSFTHWSDAYDYMLPSEIYRGQKIVFRSENGPVRVGADGKLTECLYTLFLSLNRGHRVTVVTNNFSKDHCFPELLDFEQDLEVVNYNFPRTIFGKCYALCAFIRFCLAALYICLCHRDSDVIVSDLISAPLPILRLLTKCGLLFYCHFPDQLLTKRDSFWKSVYRTLIDRVEAWSMGWADKVLVNSHFTEGVVRDTFPSLSNWPLTVLYPPLNCDSINSQCRKMEQSLVKNAEELSIAKLDELKSRMGRGETTNIFLSINRFERKKGVELAVCAFANLRKALAAENRQTEFDDCFLVLAGGYDKRNAENIAYHRQLVEIVDEVGLQKHVKFVLSPGDFTKIWLLKHATLVVYTPEREHFGIVPLEAMFMRCPVVAVNSGGPLESIGDGTTGFLRDSDPEEFGKVMKMAVDEPTQMRELGKAGRIRVENHFSFAAFSDKIDQIVGKLCNSSRQQ